MEAILQFALLGLGGGALTAALGLSLCLVYRGSGTINMGTGAVALIGAYTFYTLRQYGQLWVVPIPHLPNHIDLGGPWGTAPALVAAVVVSALVAAVFDLVVLRQLRTSAPLARLLASLGLLIVIEAAVALRFGSDGQQASAVFPDGPNNSVTVFGATVPSDRLWLAGVAVALAVVLTVAYRFTRFGIATRAAAESEVLAELAGLSPTMLALTSSVGAGALAGLMGALTASQIPLDPVTMPLAVVPALAAALLGRFTSFGLTALFGLALGVLESITIYLQSRTWFPTSDGQPLPGVADLVVFVVVVIAVLLRGSSLPRRGALRERTLPPVPEARRVALPSGLSMLVILAAFLVLPFGFRQALINSLIGVVICLSITVITGFVGQISLLQIALAGVSGFAVSEAAAHLGLGFPLGPILGILAATVLGLLTATSALRIRGVNLAIVSIAGAVALQSFGFQNPLWGGGSSTLAVPEPHVFGLDIGTAGSFPINGADQPSPLFGILTGLVAVLVAAFVANLRRSQHGKRMLAVRSNERAAAAAGVDVRRVKLGAFAVSSAIAGVGGVLYAYNFGSVSASNFDVLLALTFLAFAYIGGITTVTGAVIGGIGVTQGIVGYVLDRYTVISPQYQLLLGGLALMVAITRQPDGVAGALTSRRRRSSNRPTTSRAEPLPAPPLSGPADHPLPDLPTAPRPTLLTKAATGPGAPLGGGTR